MIGAILAALTRSTKFDLRTLLCAVLAIVVTACASSPQARKVVTDAADPTPDIGVEPEPAVEPLLPPAAESPYPNEATRRPRFSQIYPGSGEFVNEEKVVRTDLRLNEQQDVTLNFEAASVREVVALILGEVLQENYVIDPAVQGEVTMRTSRALDRGALLTILETVLEVNDAVLIEADDTFKIVPTAKALTGVRQTTITAVEGKPGYQVRIIPLRFIAAAEMEKIVTPFLKENGVLRVDGKRNLLVVSGNALDLAQVEDIVELFDVDWLEGMSFALLPIQYTAPDTIVAELEAVFSKGGEDDDGPLGNIVRLVPIERLGSLMVISAHPRYIRQAETWIARLDVPGSGQGRRVFVYRVQNGRAEDLAAILSELFGLETSSRETGPPELAPGATPKLVQLRPGDDASAGADSPAAGVIRPGPVVPAEPPPPAAAEAGPQPGPAQAADGSVAAVDAQQVSIVADPSRNALLVLATPGEYAKLEAALAELDVPPLQVLLEATIVDVNLAGELSHGVQWFFDHRLPQTELLDNRLDFVGRATVGLPLGFPGTLSYSIVNAAGEVRALLNILATEDRLKVVASPSIMVLDNETATIRVGDQQPISTTVVTEGGVVSTSVQFKDTGVTLSVTPRVNASGLVILDVSQELTDTGAIDDATGQRAFLQRSVDSRVALHSGESVVLGGLIRENDTRSESGMPFLHKLPVIGAAFGQKVNTFDRTELLVVLQATVVRDRKDLRALAKEFRRRMEGIYPPANETGTADGRAEDEAGAGTDARDDAPDTPAADAPVEAQEGVSGATDAEDARGEPL